jgi:hypothetical protein
MWIILLLALLAYHSFKAFMFVAMVFLCFGMAALLMD